MRTRKQFKIAGIIIMLLGLIHLCATPIVFPIFKANQHINLVSIYMFALVGVNVLFVGWLQLFTIKRLNTAKAFITILRATVLLVCISGIGGVATMWNNPFAYIILFVALYEVILFQRILITKGISKTY